MKIQSAEIRNYRALKELTLPLDPQLTVLHGPNGSGKTSVLNAIARALGGPYQPFGMDLPEMLAEVTTEPASETDIRDGADFAGIRLELEGSHPPLTSRIGGQLGAWRWSHDKHGRLLPFTFYDIDRHIHASFTPAPVPEPNHEPIGGSQPWRPDYSELWDWFYARENAELRQQRDSRDFEFHDPHLTAIREAIEAMVEGASRPRIEFDPLRLVVDLNDGDAAKSVSLEQLSEGYRTVLALAADLAWRMANMGTPTEAPLAKEMIVLIDEIELHLHPAWQQRILPDLMRTFPNVQFIVSTHSPQVLTAVDSRHIICLEPEGEEIVARRTGTATYGAEAGEVLECVMGVDERPDNEFSRHLQQYRRLISLDRGKEPEALELRTKLDELSPHDPALDIADLEVRQRELFRKSNKPT